MCSLDELLFLIVDRLCEHYGGLNPIRINEETFSDVIALYSDMRRMEIRAERQKNAPIRRRASDNAGWW